MKMINLHLQGITEKLIMEVLSFLIERGHDVGKHLFLKIHHMMKLILVDGSIGCGVRWNGFQMIMEYADDDWKLFLLVLIILFNLWDNFILKFIHYVGEFSLYMIWIFKKVLILLRAVKAYFLMDSFSSTQWFYI